MHAISTSKPAIPVTGARKLLLALFLMTSAHGNAQTTKLPSSAWIPTVGHVKQTYNNCGPASIIAAMNAYGLTADQTALAYSLKASPNGYMTTSVIQPFLNSVGLSTVYYQSGSITHVKRLVAAGVPVIVLQYLDRLGGVPHYRTVRGYDDKAGIMWFSDSMYGAASYLSYRDFDRLWNIYNRSFFPVFPRGWEKNAQLVVAGKAMVQPAGGGR